jgi:hypothetical protein
VDFVEGGSPAHRRICEGGFCNARRSYLNCQFSTEIGVSTFGPLESHSRGRRRRCHHPGFVEQLPRGLFLGERARTLQSAAESDHQRGAAHSRDHRQPRSCRYHGAHLHLYHLRNTLTLNCADYRKNLYNCGNRCTHGRSAARSGSIFTANWWEKAAKYNSYTTVKAPARDRGMRSWSRRFAPEQDECNRDISTATICPCSSLFRRLAQQLRRFAEPYKV